MSRDARPVAMFFGHSHMWAVANAIARTGEDDLPFTPEVIACGLNDFPGPMVYTDANGTTHINSALLSSIHKANGRHNGELKSWLVGIVQGNYYNQIGLLNETAKFDFVLPSAPDLDIDADATLIPFTAVRECLLEKMSELAPFSERIGQFSSEGVIFVGSPPPARSDAEVHTHLKKQNLDPDSVHINSSTTRLKLWRLQDEIARGIVERDGHIYISGNVPSTIDSDGFLIEEFVKDFAHANYKYALEALSQISGKISPV